eukprot:13026982-Alexandrium_andersonii.AAC.1
MFSGQLGGHLGGRQTMAATVGWQRRTLGQSDSVTAGQFGALGKRLASTLGSAGGHFGRSANH